MGVNQFLPYFVHLLGVNLPALIVLILCAMLTIANWRRHPPSARWALVAIVWLVFTYLLAITFYTFGSLVIMDGGQGSSQTPYILALSCCEGLGYVFFMFAINAARTPYRPPQFYDDLDSTDAAPPPSDGSFTAEEPRRRPQLPDD